jgi:hypothetical protein
MYQHHILLKTAEPLDSETAMDWLGICKRFSPEGVVFSYNKVVNDHVEVAMEYGTDDNCPEFPHTYIVPLTRDLTQEETAIVVAAWDYKFIPDFNIEISNMYDVMQDVELDIDPEVVESATLDLNKWHHNRWRDEMLKEGWHYGLYFSESKKSHPALRDWDSLPESHRRSPQFDNKEIFEWLRKNGVA